MDKKSYYKYLFLISAIWNWIIGIIFFLIPLVWPAGFGFFGVAVPPSNIFIHAFFGLVFIFGIGYFIIFLDINKNHAILIIGAVSKGFVFVNFLVYLILGEFNFIGFIPVIIDLIFACLFVEFLIGIKKIE